MWGKFAIIWRLSLHDYLQWRARSRSGWQPDFCYNLDRDIASDLFGVVNDNPESLLTFIAMMNGL